MGEAAALRDPVDSAEAIGLHYVRGDEPGFQRLGNAPRFRYVDSRGHRITNEDQLARIRRIAIPPAWTDVWICADEDGHIQATGRDARGRKQYRYHPHWRDHRDETKFRHVIAFASALPALRRQIEEDLRRPGLDRRKVLAAVVRLLELTLIRVGNEEYALSNHSYGLSTLRDRHVDIKGKTLRFRFRGKSGIHHEIALADPRLARVVRRCQDLPGQELFQYEDAEGGTVNVTSADVNDYIRELCGQGFTAKDFRTWGATVLAFVALGALERSEAGTLQKQQINAAIDKVASRLGNTRTVCRHSYIHPGVIDAFVEGRLSLAGADGDRVLLSLPELDAEEHRLLAFLKKRERERPAALEDALAASLRQRRRGRKRSSGQ
jgi:DNA topoisomerase-1